MKTMHANYPAAMPMTLLAFTLLVSPASESNLVRI